MYGNLTLFAGDKCYFDGIETGGYRYQGLHKLLSTYRFLGKVVRFSIGSLYGLEEGSIDGVGLLEIVDRRIVISEPNVTHIIWSPPTKPLPSYDDSGSKIEIKNIDMEPQAAKGFVNRIRLRRQKERVSGDRDIQVLIASGILGLDDDDRRY